MLCGVPDTAFRRPATPVGLGRRGRAGALTTTNVVARMGELVRDSTGCASGTRKREMICRRVVTGRLFRWRPDPDKLYALQCKEGSG